MKLVKNNANFKKILYIVLTLSVIAFFVWRFIRPVNIFVVDERFERPMKIETPKGLNSVSAKECKNCHEEIYNEWSESMHAKAWTDPYYQIDYAFDGYYQVCLNCHIPLENQQENLVLGFNGRGKFKPILEPNPDFDPELQNEGVTCIVCHIKDGEIVGPFGSEDSPHSVVADPEMTYGIKACKKCHVVGGNRWDTFYRIPPCGTVTEIEKGGQKIDCIGCHMTEVFRPMAYGMDKRKGRKHFFFGGHHPETVKKSLKVEYRKEVKKDKYRYIFTLTNVGAAHYLPTGTPDRHLTLELRLLDRNGNIMKEKIHKMKRYILWRPFIVDIKDTRLPYNKPREYVFKFSSDDKNLASVLDVTLRYHLLDEARRKRIGYENKEPIAYPIYKKYINID